MFFWPYYLPCLCIENETLNVVFILSIDLLSYMFIVITVNCLDRHVSRDPSVVAIIWEKNNPGEQEEVSYKYVCYNGTVEILNGD